MSNVYRVPHTPQIEISTSEIGGFEVAATYIDASSATVELRGEMDLATADLALAVLDNQLTSGHRFVRLDLSGLTFVDGSGLRVLVAAHNKFKAAHGSMVLTGTSPQAARLLRITRLEEALPIADAPGGPDGRVAPHLRAIPEQ